MRIIKFNESLSKEEIDDLLLDLKDSGYEVESDIYGGFVTITGKIFETDRIQFMKDVIELNSRMVSIGYEYLNDKLHVYMGKLNGDHYCQFMLKFKDIEVSTNKDVNSFEEFKEYVEKVLDLKFYEWDTEVFIPDLEVGRSSVSIKLDINKEKGKFFIVFEKGGLSNIQSNIDISDVVMTDDEWQAVNLWSAIESEKERLLDPELQKRANSKVFGFNKRGIEVVEKCVNAINR